MILKYIGWYKVTNTQDLIKKKIYKLIGPTKHDVFKRKHGMRLTSTGCKLLSKHATSYAFVLPETLKTKHLIQITRQFKYPYYLSKKYIIIFSSEDAILIKMCGSAQAFLENYID